MAARRGVFDARTPADSLAMLPGLACLTHRAASIGHALEALGILTAAVVDRVPFSTTGLSAGEMV